MITKARTLLLPFIVVAALQIVAMLEARPLHAEPRVGIRPILGVQADLAPSQDGLAVDAVMPETPAARMGIRQGDVLLSLNGKPMTSVRDVHAVMQRLSRGQRLRATFRHDGKVCEAEDGLPDVPVLPTYEIAEGRGIKGSIALGDTREQIEKALGKAPGEGDRDSFKVLAYPRHGITVFMLPAEGTLRAALIRVQYPFVGKTSRGLSTVGRRQDVARVYPRDRITREATATRTGRAVETLAGLGIQFICLEDEILEVLVTPPEMAPAEPSPRPSP